MNIFFRFLFVFKKVTNEDTLSASCLNLEHSLRSGIHLDINNDVFYGSKNSSETNTQKIRKHIEVLDFLKETKDSFQNMEF